MGPEVSIIIPVYNTEKYLTGCLDSILKQTLQKWELILIDDGSRDSSGKICDEYASKDARIRVVHKRNEGVSIARNVGLDMAEGKYIGFVDSDDTILPTMYERMCIAADEFDTDIVMCDATTVFQDGREEPDTIGQLDRSCVIERKNWTPVLLKEMAGSACRCIYSRDLLHRHAVSFATSLKFSEDRVFNIYMMGYATKVFYLKEAFYQRLIWPGSAVHRYHADYFDAVKRAALETRSALCAAWGDNPVYQNAYQEQFITASIGAINNFFYSTSPLSWKEKFEAVKRVCDDAQLKQALRISAYGGIRGKWIAAGNVGMLGFCACFANWCHGR